MKNNQKLTNDEAKLLEFLEDMRELFDELDDHYLNVLNCELAREMIKRQVLNG